MLQAEAAFERAVCEHVVQLCRELEAAQDVAKVCNWPTAALCCMLSESILPRLLCCVLACAAEVLRPTQVQQLLRGAACVYLGNARYGCVLQAHKHLLFTF